MSIINSKCDIKYQKGKVPSLEQCYQWCKATLFDDDRTTHINMHSDLILQYGIEEENNS